MSIPRPIIGLVAVIIVIGGFVYFGTRSPRRGTDTKTPLAQTTNVLAVNTQPDTTATQQRSTATTTAQQIKTPPSREIIFLHEVFGRFGKTKTFRATLSIPEGEGFATGTLAFSREQGMYGQLQLANGTRAEVILTSSKIYFKSNTSTWADVSDSIEGKQMALLFQSAFATEEGNAYLPEQTVFMSFSEDPADCRLYTIDRAGGMVAPEPIGICVNKDNLPARITAQTENGIVEVRYYDFNKPLEIPKPGV